MSRNLKKGMFKAAWSLGAIYSKSGGRGAWRKNADELTRAFHPSGEVRVDLSQVPARDWRVITQALETGVIGENGSAAFAILQYLIEYVAPMPGVFVSYVGKTNLSVLFPVAGNYVYADEDGEKRADELVALLNPLLSLQHGTKQEICGKSRSHDRRAVTVYSSGYRIPDRGSSFGTPCLDAVRPLVVTAIDYPGQSEPRKKLLERIKDKPIITVPFNGV